MRTPICVPGTTAFARWLEDIRISEFETYCNRTDVAVLTGLYRTTGGENWHRSGGWGEGVVLETWHGVRADSLGRAVALDLADNGLEGRVPGSLAQLTRLTELRIGGNALTGPLPLALAKLPLREFGYADTDLCVPDDERFRDWRAGLASHDGPGLQCSLSYREILASATTSSRMRHSSDVTTNATGQGRRRPIPVRFCYGEGSSRTEPRSWNRRSSSMRPSPGRSRAGPTN